MSWRLIGCSIVVALLAADMMVTCTGSRGIDYSFGAVLGTGILQSVRFLLLVRPLEEYRHESDKVPAYQLPFTQRFFWLLKMIHSPRGIGWSFKAENSVIPVDPRHRTRASFIASRLRWLLSHYLLLDVATLYMRCNPALVPGASVTSQGYILQCLNVAAVFCQPYATLTCIHCASAVLAVGANLDEPQAWPQLFGHRKDAYTIRKFWGKMWHQILRHDLTLFGPHRPKRNPWDPVSAEHSSASNLYVVLQFGIWNDLSSISASKPVGVLVEDAVMEVGKRTGLKEGTWARMAGYAWVVGFTSFSLAFSLDGLSNAFRVARRPGEVVAVHTTLIEVMADRVFGVQLAPLMSWWFAGV
ncbi:hypothetical protein F5141DRAFT_1215754 [Pisolithus sp. B1]|nr:hypothetical protein F5141DRAFT_1215754 [Pisolithus sp. B1]